jgi:hypothetical protein
MAGGRGYFNHVKTCGENMTPKLVYAIKNLSSISLL